MGHAHQHGHGHSHGTPGGRRLLLSVALNLLITVAEVVGGLLSGSLALLSDALHNLSDTSSLAISYVARRIGQREATRRKTFGYQRAEVIAALINLVTLVLIALYLMVEAVQRFLDPQPIDGPVMLIVASIGLAANLATAWLLWAERADSLNIRSAFLHIVADAVSSVGVVIGGVLIWQYDVTFVDPLLTLLISVYILVHSYRALRETIDLLMEGTPPDLDLDEVLAAVQALDAVQDLHHLHVWRLDEARTALEAHVVIDEGDLAQMEAIKRRIKQVLKERFAIEHSTLEFEFAPCGPPEERPCYDRPVIPDE